jgi:hypothetical protein
MVEESFHVQNHEPPSFYAERRGRRYAGHALGRRHHGFER